VGVTPLERITAALGRHAPELSGLRPTELGRGVDNTTFVVGGLVIRVGDARDVLNEAQLLDVVGDRVSIPVPVCRFADREHQVLAYHLLPGRPLLGRSPPDDAAVALGTFLRGLHTIDTANVDGLVPVDDSDPADWLDGLAGPSPMLDLVRATVPVTARHRVLAHADLGAEHILEHDGVLTGVIDWTDAAITDPAVDFGRLYRDFGPRFLGDVISSYGGLGDADDTDETMARITFFARCAALEDIAYGRDSGRREYEWSATRSLGWLFPSEV
jgi:aminoglycoside phosphotransferase (APT) family kinase protein